MIVEQITGTVEENFNLALQEEDIIRHMSFTDPYRRIGKANVEYYLSCAAALERGEKTLNLSHKDRFTR